MTKVILDPGHGGADSGGGSNQIWKEKDFVLQISLYQEKRLKELGVEVLLTRDKDTTLSAEERTSRVRGSGANCCISNHINSGGGEGVEIIHSIHRDSGLATLILDAVAESGQKKRRAYTRTLTNDPSQDYYFMHRNTGTIETVIVEYGFADNDHDVSRLQKNWKIYAEAAILGLCQYLEHPYTTQNNELKSAIDLLVEHGLMVSPEYWLQNAMAGKRVEGEYAAILISNMANKLKQGELLTTYTFA